MNIILIGMMGSGKSTVGRRVALELDWDFYDMDVEIEKEEGQSVSQIFALLGEHYFRSLEKKMVVRMALKDNSVIATGGGVPCDPENWEVLSKRGSLVWLKASPKMLMERIQKSPLERRPLLKGKESLGEWVEHILTLREPVYRKADWILETDGLKKEEVAKKIVDWVRMKQ